MPEYVLDEAFEHRLERMLREMGNEAVRPFDAYETTQLVVTSTRIGGVPFVAPPTAQPAAPPPLYPPPLYPEYPEYPEYGAESRRWPLLAAFVVLIAALAFAGFATGFIKLPSNFGITIGSPAPITSPSPFTSPSPVVTASPQASSAPERTRRPRRSRRPAPTAAPTQLQVTAAPTDAFTPTPTLEPAPTTAPTQLVLPTSDPAIEPTTEPSNATI